MRLSRWVRTQLAIFAVIAVIAGSVMVLGYMKVPALMGIGQYTVTMQLAGTGGLYRSGNVTFRGTQVGRVTSVHLTDSGDVEAVLSLRSDVSIPADLDAQVHSTSAIGEQYVALIPRGGDGPALRDGDVIPQTRTSVPPDINTLLDAANRGLEAIPPDAVTTVVDEGYVAVGGLGPEIARIVRGSTRLAIDARANIAPITSLIDNAGPVLNSQVETSDSIREWAAHIADVTGQVRGRDADLATLLADGGRAADEARRLVERLQPTVPVLLANLVATGELALTYNPAIEQLLVLLPMGVQVMAAGTVANRGSTHPGLILSFNLNLNLPPPCTTGYLPAQQQRIPTLVDTPDRPAEDLYCRIPQDSWMAVRGARNLPCLTRPGKRAPTAKMCESDDEYVPLNDGFNWKGDPNATLTGQPIPQPPPQSDAAQLIPSASYDPATGSYIGPDGRVYTQGDLAPGAGPRDWQSLLLPPAPPG